MELAKNKNENEIAFLSLIYMSKNRKLLMLPKDSHVYIPMYEHFKVPDSSSLRHQPPHKTISTRSALHCGVFATRDEDVQRCECPGR